MQLFAVRFANSSAEFVILGVGLVCRERNGSEGVKDTHTHGSRPSDKFDESEFAVLFVPHNHYLKVARR